jgi:hypothetical protein
MAAKAPVPDTHLLDDPQDVIGIDLGQFQEAVAVKGDVKALYRQHRQALTALQVEMAAVVADPDLPGARPQVVIEADIGQEMTSRRATLKENVRIISGRAHRHLNHARRQEQIWEACRAADAEAAPANNTLSYDQCLEIV